MDPVQREEALQNMEGHLIANRLSMDVGSIKKLRIPRNYKIVEAFGDAPHVKRPNGKLRKPKKSRE